MGIIRKLIGMRLSYDLEALLMCTQNFFGLFAVLKFLSLFNQELIHSSPKFYCSTNCLKHFSLYIDLDQYFHWLSKWDQSLISALFYHYWTQWIWALIKKKKYQKSQEVLKQVDIFFVWKWRNSHKIAHIFRTIDKIIFMILF